MVQNTESTMSDPAESVCLALHRAAKTVAGEKSISSEVSADATLVSGGARLGGEKIELKKLLKAQALSASFISKLAPLRNGADLHEALSFELTCL